MKKTAVLFFTLSFYSLSLTGITCEPDIINQVEGSPFATNALLPIEFHPTGKFLGVITQTSIRMFNVGLTGQLTQIGEFISGLGINTGISFSPDGTLLVTGSNLLAQVATFLVNADGTLTLVGIFSTTPGGSFNPVFSPNSKVIATLSLGTNTVTTLSVDSTGAATVIGTFATQLFPVDLDFNFDGSLLAVVNRTSDSISMFSVGSNGFLTKIADTPITGGTFPLAIAFHPKGNLLATANQNSANVSLFSVSSAGTLTELPALPVGGAPTDLQFNPLGTLLAVSKRDSSNMNLFEITKDLEFSEAAGSPFSIAVPKQLDFSPGNNFLAVGNGGATEVITEITMFCIKRDLGRCTKALIDKYQPICPIQ